MKRLFLPLSLLFIALSTACSAWLTQSEKTQIARWETSPQYSDGIFSNPEQRPPLSLKDGLTMIPKFLFSSEEREPNRPLPKQQVDLLSLIHI